MGKGVSTGQTESSWCTLSILSATRRACRCMSVFPLCASQRWIILPVIVAILFWALKREETLRLIFQSMSGCCQDGDSLGRARDLKAVEFCLFLASLCSNTAPEARLVKPAGNMRIRTAQICLGEQGLPCGLLGSPVTCSQRCCRSNYSNIIGAEDYMGFFYCYLYVVCIP